MAYSFKKFTETNKKYETRVTVTRSRYIGMPAQFCKDNNVVAYNFAVLYYDDASKAIGIKLSNDEHEKGRLKIAKSKQGYGATVAAQSFFKMNGIDTETFAGRYDYKKIPFKEVGIGGNGNLLVIELVAKRKEPMDSKE